MVTLASADPVAIRDPTVLCAVPAALTTEVESIVTLPLAVKVAWTPRNALTVGLTVTSTSDPFVPNSSEPEEAMADPVEMPSPDGADITLAAPPTPTNRCALPVAVAAFRSKYRY